MRSTDRYVCFCCCKAVDPRRFHGLCTDPDCVRQFIERCGPAERQRRVSSFISCTEIDVERSLFMNIDPRSSEALTTPNHIVYSPADGRCDICGKEVDELLCPVCHCPVSLDGRRGSNIIAVLGSEYSGKSHYTSALIDVLTDRFCREFGAEVMPVLPRTEEVRKLLKRRLFEDGTIEYSSEPLVYNIKMDMDGKPVFHTLALYDSPSTDIRSQNGIESVATGTLITGAAALIYILDPLSLPPVRKALGMSEIDEPDHAARLNEVADTIRLRRHQSRKNVDVPLAVVMTKVDVLMRMATNENEDRVLFGPESSLNIPRAPGMFDAVNAEQISMEVGEYLRRYAPPAFMTAVRRFDIHRFFAVSSLGHCASPGVPPVPFRVEDPIIWLTTELSLTR